jgi:hypothetical protein
VSPIAKATGLGWSTLSVDDSGGTLRAVINDITDLDFATPRAVFDVTGVDKSAYERLLGLADFTINLNAVWNPAATTTMFAVFSTMGTARTTTLVVGGKTLSNECLYTDFQLKRGNDGDFRATIPGVLSDGTVPSWS